MVLNAIRKCSFNDLALWSAEGDGGVLYEVIMLNALSVPIELFRQLLMQSNG